MQLQTSAAGHRGHWVEAIAQHAQMRKLELISTCTQHGPALTCCSWEFRLSTCRCCRSVSSRGTNTGGGDRLLRYATRYVAWGTCSQL